ncbi:MAG: hypothetical protein KF812_07625 [Fimbriimonadaceae bacterium]|nr:hypothetical protein [Fimbriimonadaceae bacterium]
MTTLLALSFLAAPPLHWTSHVQFSEQVKADREAYDRIAQLKGEVINFQQQVFEVKFASDSAHHAGEPLRFGIQKVSRDANREESAWLMGVGPNYTRPVDVPHAGAIGPRTLTNIIKMVDAFERESQSQSEASAMTYRTDSDTVTMSNEVVSVSGYYFMFSFPRAVYPGLRSEWIKLPGIKLD